MRKKPPIRYVDMAIYVDANIHNKDHDVEKVFNYLVMLAYMLSIKRHFFHKEVDYDNYAQYLATIVYTRMTTPRQYLDESDPKYLTPVKSCLNYMKQILYARKCAYCNEEFNSTTQEDSLDSEITREYMTEQVMATPNSLLACDVKIYLKTIDGIIQDCIYKGVYGNDPVLAWKLYTSSLISLLRNFTLSNKNKKRISRARALNYEENLEQIMVEETASAPVVYDLDNKYLDYIAITLQKVKTIMIKDIRELSAEYTYPDDMLEDMFMLEANFGEDLDE